MLTFYSKCIHRPAKIVLFSHLVRADDGSISGKNKKVKKRQNSIQTKISTRIQVKFAWIISVLHTNNKFGITYGPCGLVTVNTFAKFVILYLKFLLITYKMQNRLAKNT